MLTSRMTGQLLTAVVPKLWQFLNRAILWFHYTKSENPASRRLWESRGSLLRHGDHFENHWLTEFQTPRAFSQLSTAKYHVKVFKDAAFKYKATVYFFRNLPRFKDYVKRFHVKAEHWRVKKSEGKQRQVNNKLNLLFHRFVFCYCLVATVISKSTSKTPTNMLISRGLPIVI